MDEVDEEKEDYEKEWQMEQGSQSGDVKDKKQAAEDGDNSEDDDEETSEEHNSGEIDEETSEESEYEDYGDERQTAERFFTAKKYINNRHRWLVGFYDYLSRLSAGHKKIYI